MLQRFIDPAAVAAEIERVRSLSGHALRRRWQSAFGRSPPEHLTADLLRRMIAAKVQEEAFGTLDRATLKLLDGLALAPAQPSATSRSAPCWSATIRAGATPSRSSPTAMSGRDTPIPACRRSPGRSPARPGAARASSP